MPVDCYAVGTLSLLRPIPCYSQTERKKVRGANTLIFTLSFYECRAFSTLRNLELDRGERCGKGMLLRDDFEHVLLAVAVAEQPEVVADIGSQVGEGFKMKEEVVTVSGAADQQVRISSLL